ncbi:MAG TPA: hypothetical protein VMS31_23360, partial [Pyrinomonadaceae bacterium]|nr:hypothetical protein [Pyrinomonadaceae bacterium]
MENLLRLSSAETKLHSLPTMRIRRARFDRYPRPTHLDLNNPHVTNIGGLAGVVPKQILSPQF